MIIEIALGIVLAVVILRLWPLILAGGFLLVAGAVAFGAIAIAIYFAVNNPGIFAWLIVGFCAFVGVVAYSVVVPEKTLLTLEESWGLLVIVGLLIATIVSIFDEFRRSGDATVELVMGAVYLAIVAVIFFVWSKALKARKVSRKGMPPGLSEVERDAWIQRKNLGYSNEIPSPDEPGQKP